MRACLRLFNLDYIWSHSTALWRQAHLSLDLLLDFLLDLLNGASDTLLLRLLPDEDTRDLNDSDESEEEVDGGEAEKVSYALCKTSQGMSYR